MLVYAKHLQPGMQVIDSEGKGILTVKELKSSWKFPNDVDVWFEGIERFDSVSIYEKYEVIPNAMTEELRIGQIVHSHENFNPCVVEKISKNNTGTYKITLRVIDNGGKCTSDYTDTEEFYIVGQVNNIQETTSPVNENLDKYTLDDFKHFGEIFDIDEKLVVEKYLETLDNKTLKEMTIDEWIHLVEYAELPDIWALNQYKSYR